MKTLKTIEQILFYLLSWGFAVALLVLFFSNVDISKPGKVETLYYVFFILGIMFVFLPFMKKVNVANILELERNIQETKNEIKEFKSEIGQILTVMSTSISTISSNVNTVNISMPGSEEIEKAREKLQESTDENTLKSATKIKEDLILEDEDLVMALARTRIRIEFLLRRIIEKQVPEIENVKFNTRGLFREFKAHFPQYSNMEEPFTFVMSMCTAAMHSHYLPKSQAEEALDMGSKVIAVLLDIQKNEKAA